MHGRHLFFSLSFPWEHELVLGVGSQAKEDKICGMYASMCMW